MTYDNDKTPALGELCAEISAALTPARSQTEILHRQTQALDRLFSTVLDRYIGPKLENGQSLEYQLPLLLRVQRQCMDTAKAAETIAYMQGLAAKSFPPPPLAKNDEQTEGGQK